MNIRRITGKSKADKESSFKKIELDTSQSTKTNKISTQSFSLVSLIPTTIFELLQLPAFLWFLFLIALELTPVISELSLKLSVILPFSIIFLKNFLKNCLLLRTQYLHDKQLNSKLFAVYQEPGFIAVQSGQIVEGDIVLVKNSQEVPADSLILAADSEKNEFFIRNSKFDENSGTEKKKAIKETQVFITEDGMSVSEAKRHIESIKIVQPNPFYDKVEAKIKVKNNPRVIRTTLDNFVMGQSEVVDCEWILCLVVYVGLDSKKWNNFQQVKMNRVSKLDRELNYALIINFALVVFMVLVNSFLGVYWDDLLFDDRSIDIGFYSIVLYASLVPVTLYLALHVYKSIKSILLMVTNFKNNPKIVDTNSLDDLGKVEYIITERTGVLTDQSIIVQACLFNNCLYQLSADMQCEDPASDSEANEEVSITNKSQNNFESSSFESFKNEISSENCPAEKLFFAFCLALCNTFTNESSFDTTNEVDSAFLSFAESLGIQILKRQKNKVELEFNSSVYKFSINSLSRTTNKDFHFKATIKDYTTNEVFLVYKLQSPVIEPSELEDDYSNAQESLDSFQLKKFRKIVFLFKKLQKLEIKKIYKEYNEALQCKVNRKLRLSAVFDSYKTQMKFLGLVGIENSISSQTVEAVGNLVQSGVKIWIASSSCEESVLATAHHLKLVDPETSIVQFHDLHSVSQAIDLVNLALKEHVIYKGDVLNLDLGKSEREKTRRNSKRNLNKALERKSDVKAIFADMGIGSILQKPIKSLRDVDLNFVVSFDADLMTLALKSRELMKNLIVLMFTSRAVLVNSVNPELKSNLVRIVKENFEFKPVVMAVGLGQKCFKMIIEANVGVKVEKSLDYPFFCDIQVEEFGQLEKAILDIGHNAHHAMRIIYRLFMFKEGMTATLFFLYQSRCSFSACQVISWDLVIIWELLTSFSFVLLFGLTFKDQGVKGLSRKFKKNFLTGDLKIVEMLLQLGHGVIQGGLIMVFVSFGIPQVSSADGLTEDSETLGLTSFVLVNFVLFAHGLVISRDFKSFFWVFLYSFALVVIVLASACNSDDWIGLTSSQSFTERPIIWILLVFYPFIAFVIAKTFNFAVRRIFMNVKERLVKYQELENVFSDHFRWKVVQERKEFEIDAKTLKFKDLYREKEYMNSMYQQSMHVLKWSFVVGLVLEVLNNIFIEVGLKGFLDLGVYTVIITCFAIALVFVGFFLLNSQRFVFIELLSLGGFLVFSLVETYVNTTSWTIPRYPIYALLYSLLICSSWITSISKFITIYFVSIAALVYETYIKDNHGLAVHTSHWCIIMFFILILILLVNFQQEKNKRNQYTFIKQAEIEVEKSSTILSYLLPEFVRKRVKDGARYISEDKGTVSIVFCDIYDFDTILNLYSPQELTFLLNDLFGRIDLICDNYGVTKIETVGKTYLACAGLKDSEINFDPQILRNTHARRAVELALAILKESEKIILKNGEKLKFKIGVNSGPVTAGVVGFHKPQFSLVGDTVNTASRMASTLKEVDSVQISLQTYELLGSTHGLNFVDYVREVKGKGNMDTKIVSLIEQASGDNSEDFSSIQGNLINSLKSNKSSPTFTTIHARGSESSIPKKMNRRSSILDSVGVNNTQELVSKQTTQKIQGIFTFLCKETETEKKLRLAYIQEISATKKIGLLTSVTCDLFLIIAELLYYLLNLEHASLPRLLTVFIGEVLMIILIVLRSRYSGRIMFSLALSSLYTAEFIGIFVSEYFSEHSVNILYMYFAYKFLLLNFFTGTFFAKSIYFNLVTVSIWLVETFKTDPSLPSITYTFVFIIIVLHSVYSDERRLRANTLLKLVADKEIAKTQQLLTHMMPPSALANLEEGRQVMDRLNQVTVMYADIVGFTAWSSVRSPREVVGMLSELFTHFDKKCIEHNVYKVHTIGDCYVAMGYIDDKNRNPAREAVNMLEFANSLIGIIAETNEKCGIQLGMRIGMHTGQITGGITGTKIVRYDIYGQHVQIANKMESSGEAGRVAVSESTKELIESYKPGLFLFEKAKEVTVDKNSIELYFSKLSNEALTE